MKRSGRIILLLLTLPFLLMGLAPLDEQLLKAAKEGNLQKTSALLKKGAQVNAADENGLTPLYVAAISGHEAVVRLLIEKGAEVDTRDYTLFGTPLLMAATLGHAATARLLLEKGARVNAANIFGVTPLHWAAGNGHEAVVRLLLEKGAEINAARKDNGWTPLHQAAVKGHEAVVRLLIEKGAHINAADQNASTPLIVAAAKGHEAVVRVLLENSADVSARNARRHTPLHASVVGGNSAVLALLLAHDAYVEVKDVDGLTPLDYARQKGLASMVRMLEEAQTSQGSVGRLSPPVPGPASPGAAPSRRSDVDSPPTVKVKPRAAAYAVVIGVEQYRNHLPPAGFAAHDAKIISEYLSRVMGYREEHIAVLLNDKAAKADMEKYIEHWLPRRVERDATVFVYFSGHGAPDPNTKEAYLVPYDGDPAFLEATGYPLKRLYDQLRRLPVREVVVLLDACFSGAGSRSVIAKGLRPVGISVEHPLLAGGNTAVLSASSGQQAAGTYEEQGHGLLTYFVLKGLRGEADQNADGAIELAELYRYVKPEIEVKARRDLNLEQTPQLLGASELLAKGIRLVERVQQ